MRIFLLGLLSFVPLTAQFIVSDPGNAAINSAIKTEQVAHHVAIMRQWAEQIDRLNRQLRQLEEQLAVQRRIRDVVGDPSAIGIGRVLQDLQAEEIARSYGETLAAAQRLSNALESLRRTANGVYRELDDRTVAGRGFTRSTIPYRRFGVVERQADTLTVVHERTGPTLRELQQEITRTLRQLQGASTQAEVDKLNGQLVALHGQLAFIAARRREEEGKLLAAHLLNENQDAKERLDLFERQQAEERDSLAIVGAWQESLSLTPLNLTRR